ncbi:MAG: hypothetical protein DRI86_11120 [Bacteroidetes bacterium]|nr:MAG: hypothetical protein DRI86_11120 [Bacteroidota bacterium]
MGKIEKFLAKPVEVTIGGEKFMITPFTVEDLPAILKLGSDNKEEAAQATKEMIMKVMKQIDPEATEEQITQVSIEYLTDIMNAIAKVNNLPMDEARAKLIQELKKK